MSTKLSDNTISTVSYTHLDVYKRQVVGYLVDGLIQSHRLSNNHSLHDIHEHCKEEEHGHGIIYLALDVYKRQIHSCMRKFIIFIITM